jgi:hypothetical protein
MYAYYFLIYNLTHSMRRVPRALHARNNIYRMTFQHKILIFEKYLSFQGVEALTLLPQFVAHAVVEVSSRNFEILTDS